MNQAALQKNRRRAQAVTRSRSGKPTALPPSQQNSRTWFWTSSGLLAAAAFLRLFELTLKPLHHDEGVNGLFLTSLFRSGYYHYDPANYHGPSLYYFGWIVTTINSVFYGKDGLSTFAIRLVTALFGIGVVWLLLCLRRQIGTFGAVAAAALATVSPGMVFFSRYFIHEILFVFFSLGIVVCFLRYLENHQPRDFLLATASAALLGTTKETWIITVGVWLIAIPCATFYLRLRNAPIAETSSPANGERLSAVAPDPVPVPAWSRGKLYGIAAAIFAGLWVLLYSSFFTNFPQGVYDSVLTFGYWFKTSHSSPHDYGWSKYLEWLSRSEAPLLLLGALGVVMALWRARERFAVFAAFWSLGILAAYSLVPYKTPWCALNIILPLIIMGGYGLQQLYEKRGGRRWAVLILVGAAGFSLYQAVVLTFIEYDYDSQPYVYAHTSRELLAMVDEIDSVAASRPEGKQVGISIMSPEHWPLPWYLRDYPNAGYWGKVVDSTQPILIVHESQVAEVDSKFGGRYRRVKAYNLRPGNELFLYLRRDIPE